MEMMNKTFGRLKVIKEGNKTKDNHKKWICLCTCGNIKEIDGRDLRRKKTTSCGCLRNELTKERIIKLNTKHGECKTRLYNIWNGMRDRCNRPSNNEYKNYGGRGISVAKEWNDYLKFKNWAEKNGYKDNLTIDRIDVNKNYEPKNCRWITIQEQANNKRTNKYITYKGKKLNYRQWEKLLNYNKGIISNRLKRGWSIERTLEEKPFIGKNQYKK